jgi:hypothetical protein
MEPVNSKNSFDDLNDNSEAQTKNDHGGNRKIEPEIFLFDPYISWQVAYPSQLIVKEINDGSY